MWGENTSRTRCANITPQYLMPINVEDAPSRLDKGINVEVLPIHTLKTYRRSGGRPASPLIRNLGITWGVGGQHNAPAASASRKEPR